MRSASKAFGPVGPIPLASEGQSHSLAPEGQSITDSNPYIIKTANNPVLKPSHRIKHPPRSCGAAGRVLDAIGVSSERQGA